MENKVMTLLYAVILLGTGVIAGFASGLLGLGGAFILVPVQYVLFSSMGLSTDLAIKMAAGTSLLVVLLTAMSGTWQHHRQGWISWRIVFIMGGVSFLASLGGATLANYLPGLLLKTIFGGLVMANALWLIISRHLNFTEKPPVTTPWVWAVWAIPIGLISGLLGVGGGILAIPIMLLALRFTEHHTVANSLGVIMITSAGGAIGYIINGLSAPGRPAYSLGYIDLFTWFLLAVTSVGMVQIGARVCRYCSGRTLRSVLVIVMFIISLQMLGAFHWLGLP
jgi:uncharacterized membrane protein YfcA